MVIARGDTWWAALDDPIGSGPGFRRPVVVVQSDALNQSRLATVVCVPLTSNLKWASAPGNVRLAARFTGLPKDSVANVSQIVSLDKNVLTERVGRVPQSKLYLILAGIDVVLGK
ncbi:MAG: type II toxin-antitoxin system PemK/MazF family toxin [Candidatus Eremiobacteraeota bacterium]|nr:type II toxin-antitoxin system PemK/MazF family toxin [Candidatus Eremiobacteraeota bacterium]